MNQLVIGTCLIFLTAWNGCAQDNARRMEFEAASVKLTANGPRRGIEETQGLIRIENLSLQTLIEIAYGVKDFQCVGPGWLSAVSLRYHGKTAGRVSARAASTAPSQSFG